MDVFVLLPSLPTAKHRLLSFRFSMLLHWLLTTSNSNKWKTSCTQEPKGTDAVQTGRKKKSLPINSKFINRTEESWSWRRRVSHNNMILCSQGCIMSRNSCEPIAMLIIKELPLMDCLHQKATSRTHTMLRSRAAEIAAAMRNQREPSNQTPHTRLNPLKKSEKKPNTQK